MPMSLQFSSILEKKVGKTKYRGNGRLNITVIEVRFKTLTPARGQARAKWAPKLNELQPQLPSGRQCWALKSRARFSTDRLTFKSDGV